METEFGTYEDFRFVQSAPADELDAMLEGLEQIEATEDKLDTADRNLTDLAELMVKTLDNVIESENPVIVGACSGFLQSLLDLYVETNDDRADIEEELDALLDDAEKLDKANISESGQDDVNPADTEPGPQPAWWCYNKRAPVERDMHIREELVASAARAALSECDARPRPADWHLAEQRACTTRNKPLVDYKILGEPDLSPPEGAYAGKSTPAPRNPYMENPSFMADLGKLLDLHGYGKGVAATAAALYHDGVRDSRDISDLFYDPRN